MNLTQKQFTTIDKWMHRNAREIDLLVWQCLFEQGNPGDVIAALKQYQNADGGFGQALEPDNWNPDSTPYTTLHAIGILGHIGFVDYRHSMYQDIIRYLGNTPDFSMEHGWNFTIPSNDRYPHAPWWTFNIANNRFENIGLNAHLCAFLLEATPPGSTLHETALQLVRTCILPKINPQEKLGEMAINGFCTILETLKDKSLIADNEYEAHFKIIASLVRNSIEYDTKKWPMYSVRPSKYIKSAASPYYLDNKEKSAKNWTT